MGVLYQSRKKGEPETQSCFSCKFHFHYPRDMKLFDELLEDFKLKSKTSKKI